MAGKHLNVFCFLRVYLETAEIFDNTNEREHFIAAIIDYGLDGKEPEFKSKLQQKIWKILLPQLNYGRTRAINGSINGRKGGAPKGNQNAKRRLNNGTE